jgi:hypothetical protein
MPDYRAVDKDGKPRYDVQPDSKRPTPKRKPGKVAPVQKALMRGGR